MKPLLLMKSSEPINNYGLSYNHRSNDFHALRQRFACTPVRTPFNHAIEILVEPGQFGAQPSQMSLNPLLHEGWRSVQAVLLRSLHRQHFSTRANRAANSCVCRSGSARSVGWITTAKLANTCASSASVFVNWPVTLAKSRTVRGFTANMGNTASTSARSRGCSKPRLASAIRVGDSWLSRAITVAMPWSSYGTRIDSSLGSTTSSCAFETSIQTYTGE
jgi:hypothetical protein